MRKQVLVVVTVLAFGAVNVSAAQAGCLKGAVVGGVAGHFAHHHAVVGAIAGCAIGHHTAAQKKKREQDEQKLRQVHSEGAH